MRALLRTSVLPLAATLTLAACTDGASTAQVTGTVSSQLSDEQSPETAEIALLWATDEGDLISSSTTVSGDFPASFSLDLEGPPPAGAILDGAPPAAFGFITALDGEVEVGFSEEVVLYLPEGADDLGDYGLATGALDAGYHLLRLVEDEDAFAAVDACYEENIDAIIACEEGCFVDNDPEALGDDAALDGCLAGCFAADPCADLVDDAFDVEVLPIDTPIELVMFDDLDPGDEPDFGEGELCLDEAFGEVDGCYDGCVGEVEACEALLDDPSATDEEIDSCFNAAFDEECFVACDAQLDEAIDACGVEWDEPAGPQPEPLDPEQEACLDEVMPDIDACYEGCEQSFADCDALFADPDASEADIDACLQELDETAFTCFEGCDQLMMDAFNSCGVEYDC